MTLTTQIAQITLRRTSDGHLRPDRPDPKTLEEAKVFGEEQDLANSIEWELGHVKEDMLKTRDRDNSSIDLNLEKGVVVTHDSWVSDEGDWGTVTAEVLSCDKKNEVASYSKSYATTGNPGAPRASTWSYTAQPLQYEHLHFTAPEEAVASPQRGDGPSENLKHYSTDTLTETPDGRIIYTFQHPPKQAAWQPSLRQIMEGSGA